MMHRRAYLKAAGSVAIAGAVAGCGGDGGGNGGGPENEVKVGPDSELAFKPDSITVSVGDTVTWSFESPTHNVSFNPEHNDKVSIPDGVEGFSSTGSASATNEEGETWSHTFETAGTYNYVCVPHASVGMTGEVVVEE